VCPTPLVLKGASLLAALLSRLKDVLSRVVAHGPVGTHLGRFHLLWTLPSGRWLQRRGALIPALADGGRCVAAVRRAGSALAYGRWSTAPLLAAWPHVVQAEAHGPAHRPGGDCPGAGDLTGFWRPRLPGGTTKPAGAQAGKARPASPCGLAARMGAVGSPRLALPCLLVRAEADDPGAPAVQRRLFHQPHARLAPADALVTDRGWPRAQIPAAGITRDGRRGPPTFPARRALLPASRGTGRRPTQGLLGRPLPRTSKGRTRAATPAARGETWQGGTRAAPGIVSAQSWDTLGRPDAPPEAPPFPCRVIRAPRFAEPLRRSPPRPLQGAQAQAMDRERGPVEGLPLGAKPRLGAARQCVFAPTRRQRLPALTLLAGSLLAYTAAPPPARATGCGDRAPRPTPGRLRRLLAQVHGEDLQELPAHLRKKQSPTAHVPTGVRGRRRQHAAPPMSYDKPCAA
jgi:hypothetical protein